MAQKKAGGSTSNGRDSNPKYLGTKCADGQKVTGGSILVRQRGTKILPGYFVGLGKDDTLFAKVPGTVRYKVHGKGRRTHAHIIPEAQQEASVA